MLVTYLSVDESLLRPFQSISDEGASSSYAMPDDALAGEISSYKIFELKKSLTLVN